MAQAPMEYTAQNLEYAVSVFYNGEHSERAQAHSWLTAAQRVPSAWQFVWELLQPNKGTEIQFYAATTLHTKILRCWHEVPPESYEELKHKLLEAILAYANGPKIVTNRLCISLAAFILQQGSSELASILRPLSNAEHMSLLLEVLTVIPEEYNSMTMGSSLRARNRAALHQACPMVLDDMMRHLHSVCNDYTTEGPSESTVQSWLRAVTCACSWLTLGGEEAELTGTLSERMPLIRALLQIVKILYTYNECVGGTALDCCEACLAGVRAAGAGADAARHPSAAADLIRELVELARPIMTRDNVPNSMNEELLSALITCLVCITECHSALVVSLVSAEPGGAARELVALLLAAQGAPGHYPAHEQRSTLVFGLWFTLQEEIVQGIEKQPPPPPVWVSVYEQLLRTLIVKAEAHDQHLARDDQELLRCYRQDVADTAMYCFFMVGDSCWETIEEAYEAATTEVRREAALHALLAVADAAPSSRAPPALLCMLQRAVDTAHTAADLNTLTTALDAIGSYASWLSSDAVLCSGRGAALAREGVRAAGAALGRAPRPAALALRRLCADCPQPAAHMIRDIVRAAQSPVCASDSWVRRQVLSACGAALVAADHTLAAPLLMQLAASIEIDLQNQVSQPLRGTGAAECAAALLAALAPAPALADALLRQVMVALPHFVSHPALVEPMFALLHQVVCSLSVPAVPAEVARLTLSGLHTQPCVAGLDLVKLVLIRSGSEWSESGPLLHGAVAAAAQAVALQPSANSDLTEALFRLLQTICKKKPQLLDTIHDLLPQLVDLACGCVRLWEAGAVRAACAFLGALSEVRPAALREQAPQLTTATLRGIGGASPRNQIEPLAELLLALNRAAWQEGSGALAGWLRQALAVNDFPTPYATDQHKHKFIAAVIKEKCSKRRIIESVQEFSLACRGLIGTEYARQTIASKQLVA